VAPPYVFRPNDPFPSRERQIFMTKPVASEAIPHSVFKRDELTWIDGVVTDTMSRPDLWVGMWTGFLRLRATGLRVNPSWATLVRTGEMLVAITSRVLHATQNSLPSGSTITTWPRCSP
jgi:hypothetical protein